MTDYERAFIALVPDQASLTRLASYSRSWSAAMGQTAMFSNGLQTRPYESADLHMTLAFLGGIHASLAAAIVQQLPNLAHPLPALTCIGEAWWPNRQTPRVHVLRYGQPPALKDLFAKVQALVRTLDLPVDKRPFRPHITLSRIRVNQPADLPQPAMTLSDGQTLRTDLAASMIQIGLFCKSLDGGRLRYRALGQFPLGNITS